MEMPIHTYLNPLHSPTPKKPDNTKCYWRCATRTLIHQWQGWKMMQTLQKHLTVSYKAKYTLILMTSPSHLEVFNQNKEKHVHTENCTWIIFSSFIHKHPKLGSIHVLQLLSTKKAVVYPYTGTLLSNEKELLNRSYITVIWDDSQMTYVKWKKPDSKSQVLYDSP